MRDLSPAFTNWGNLRADAAIGGSPNTKIVVNATLPDSSQGLKLVVTDGQTTAQYIRMYCYSTTALRFRCPLWISSLTSATVWDLVQFGTRTRLGVGWDLGYLARIAIVPEGTGPTWTQYKIKLTLRRDATDWVGAVELFSGVLNVGTKYIVDAYFDRTTGSGTLSIDGTPVATTTSAPTGSLAITWIALGLVTCPGNVTAYVGQIQQWMDATGPNDDTVSVQWVRPRSLNIDSGTLVIDVQGDRPLSACRIEYGYGNYNSTANGVGDAANRRFACTLTGIIPGTLQYRVVVTDQSQNEATISSFYGKQFELRIPGRGEPVFAIAGGDVHNTTAARSIMDYAFSRFERAAGRPAHPIGRPHLWLDTGDSLEQNITVASTSYAFTDPYDASLSLARVTMGFLPRVISESVPGNHATTFYDSINQFPSSLGTPSLIGDWAIFAYQDLSEITQQQLASLEAGFANCNREKKLLLMHIPLVGLPPASDSVGSWSWTTAQAILNLCAKYGVAIVCSHYHRTFYDQVAVNVDGVDKWVSVCCTPRFVVGGTDAYMSYAIPNPNPYDTRDYTIRRGQRATRYAYGDGAAQGWLELRDNGDQIFAAAYDCIRKTTATVLIDDTVARIARQAWAVSFKTNQIATPPND